MKKLLLTFVGLLAVLSASAGSYTITFKSNTGADSSSPFTTKTTIADFIGDGVDLVTGIGATQQVYLGKTEYGLKLSKSKGAGLLTLNMAENAQVDVTSIVVKAAKWGTDASTISAKVGDVSADAQSLSSADFIDYTFDFAGNKATTITLSAKNRLYVKSITVNYKDGGDVTDAVATPTFSIAGGLVEAGTKVSVSCATDGASIYYTLDGSDPSAGSTLYSEPITINEAVTIKAIAIKNGMEDSKIGTAVFSVPVSVADIAALLEANKSLGSNRETSTATYKLGGAVTAVYQNGNNLYVKDDSGYLLVFGSTGKNYKNGDVIPVGITGKVQNYYNLFELVEIDASTFGDGVPGTAVEPVAVKVNEVENHPVSEYVKLEGVTVANMLGTKSNFNITDPTIDGVKLTGRNNFQIDPVNGDNLTVYGFVVRYNEEYQVYPVEITSASGQEVVATPFFSVAPGEVMAGTEVAITCATEDARIYYTLNGDEPTVASTLYENPIAVSENVTIKAIAVKDGMQNSSVKTGVYTIKVLPKNVAMFDFTLPATLEPAYPADINGAGLTDEAPNKSAKVTGVHFYNGNVAVTSTKGGSTDAKIYYQSGGAIQLRVYNGGSTTIESTDPDNNIVKIVFVYNNGNTSYSKVTKPENGTWGSLDAATKSAAWTGDAQKVVFAYTGTQQINSIEVTCAKDLTEGKPIELPKAGTVAETLELANNTEVKILYDLTVGYVNGKNIFAKDADDEFIQIYGDNSYKVGDVIAGGWDAMYSLRNDIPQLTPVTMLPAATEGSFTVAVVNAAEVTADKVNYVLKVNDVMFADDTPATKSNFVGTASEVSLPFYNNYQLESVKAGKYNVTFVVSLFDKGLSLYVVDYELVELGGIDDVTADGGDGAVEYYNLQGVRVENPQSGLYIRRQGSVVSKVVIR